MPSHPLFTPFEESFPFHWPYDGRIEEIEWLKSIGEVFWRPRGAPLNFLWYSHDPYFDPFNPFYPDKAFAGAFQTGQLRRFYILTGNTLAFVNGRTAILRIESCPLDASAELGEAFIDFRKPHQFLWAESNVMQRKLTQALMTPQTDLYRSHQWLQNFEDDWSLLEFIRGDKEELKLLLQSLVKLYGYKKPAWSRQKFYFWIKVRRNTEIRFSGRLTSTAIPQQLFEFLNASFVVRVNPHARIPQNYQ